MKEFIKEGVEEILQRSCCCWWWRWWWWSIKIIARKVKAKKEKQYKICTERIFK